MAGKDSQNLSWMLKHTAVIDGAIILALGYFVTGMGCYYPRGSLKYRISKTQGILFNEYNGGRAAYGTQ